MSHNIFRLYLEYTNLFFEEPQYVAGKGSPDKTLSGIRIVKKPQLKGNKTFVTEVYLLPKMEVIINCRCKTLYNSQPYLNQRVLLPIPNVKAVAILS